MAEIKITKKSKPVWPWILALLAIVALLFWLWDGDDNEVESPAAVVEEKQDSLEDEAPGKETSRQETRAEKGGAIASYLSYVDQKGDSLGLDHHYTHKALTQLAEAISVLAAETPQSPAVSSEVNNLKQRADFITKDPMSLEHADKVHRAFSTAAGVFQKLQQTVEKKRKSEADALAKLAEEIDPQTPLLEQASTVKRFFDQAAMLIKDLSKNSPA